MLFKLNNRQGFQGIILTSLLTLLASCGNSAALESLVSADPKLKESNSEQQSGVNQSKLPQDDLSDATPRSKAADDVNNRNISSNQTARNNTQQPEERSPAVPADFPKILLYPQADLQRIETDENTKSKRLTWNTTDNRKAVADYYQAELLANNWEIIEPFVINPEQKTARAIAVKDDLRVDLTLSQADNEAGGKNTKLSIAYQPLNEDVSSGIVGAIDSTEQSQISTPEDNRDGDRQNNLAQSQPETEPEDSSAAIPNLSYSDTDVNFSDLDEVPEQLRQPLEVVSALGILTPYTGDANVELSKFAPNEAITRGEYARWLIAANNRYYSDNPGKKIYVATKTSQPAFKDVQPNHPDFAAIQSLAEAGLIPSRLSGDSTDLLFRPDAPLIREDLISWKVPLDTRQALPQASIEAIQESWGFQDTANIDSLAVRALYADFQNGDRSNLRRVFGYTTLFQPKKPVTRAEAAASLGYFGFQGDGITAQEVLEAEKSDS